MSAEDYRRLYGDLGKWDLALLVLAVKEHMAVCKSKTDVIPRIRLREDPHTGGEEVRKQAPFETDFSHHLAAIRFAMLFVFTKIASRTIQLLTWRSPRVSTAPFSISSIHSCIEAEHRGHVSVLNIRDRRSSEYVLNGGV